MKKIVLSILVFVGLLVLAAKAVNLKAESTVTLINGASMRLDEPSGIRFKAEVSNPKSGLKYGMVIGRGIFTNENLLVGAANTVNAEVDELKEDNSYNISMVNLPEYAYMQQLTARAYINDNGNYIYSDLVVTRSITDVAVAAYENGKTDDLIVKLYNHKQKLTIVNLNGGTIIPEYTLNVTKYNSLEAGKLSLIDDVTLLDNNENTLYVKYVPTINAYKVSNKDSFDYILTGDNELLRELLNKDNLESYYLSFDKPSTIDCDVIVKVSTHYEMFMNNHLYLNNEESLPNVSKEGSVFLGWYEKEDFSSDKVTEKDNHKELYAKFGAYDYKLEYTLNEETQTYSVTGIGTSTNKDIYIPNEYNGLPVTSIGANAFQNNTTIENVMLPSSVESIGSYAFSGCRNLVDVTFEGEEIVVEVKNVRNRKSRVNVVSLIKSIGDYAFQNCVKLEDIVITKNVLTIGVSVFTGCENLVIYCQVEAKPTSWSDTWNQGASSSHFGFTRFFEKDNTKYTITENGAILSKYKGTSEELIIPETIRYEGKDCTVIGIAEAALANANNLVTVKVPSTITSIGKGAFSLCNNLANIIIDEANPKYDSRENCNAVIETSTNVLLHGCKNTTFPSNVSTINPYAFYNCTGLENIVIPNTITTIGISAFEGCSNLTSITVPHVGNILDGTANTHFGYIFGATTYSKNTTKVPTSLKEVVINGGKSIYPYAFYNCSSLTSIEIPEGVTSIVGAVFSGCSSLTNITIPNKVRSIGKSAFYNCSSLESIVIPEGVTSIGSAAFSYCSSLESIVIPKSVTSIGIIAFHNCSSLTNVYYNGTIEDWCNITFGDNDSNPMHYTSHFYMLDSNNEYYKVTEIIIPETITSIGNYQFYGFNNITSIELPSSVTSIGVGAFSECSSLESIELPSGVTSIGYSAFSGCSSLESIELPSGVTSIGYSVFSGCSSLTSIEIPNSVTGIGSNAFSRCSSLESIVIPEGVTSIVDYVFSDCSSLESIVIPESVTSIGYSAFYNCSSLTSIEIPSSVTSIDNSAFYNCSSLTVYYNGTIENWCNITIGGPDSNPMKYASHFYMLDSNNEYYEVTEIVIPDTITSIGNHQFQGFNNITSIEISSSVTSIGWDAFDSCSSLESIVIPERVTSIVNYAFNNCYSLTNVYYKGTIENWCNITFSTMDSNPMYYASNFYMLDSNNEYYEVTEIAIPETITSIGKFQFYKFKNITSIKISSTVTSIGIYAFYNCRSLESIEIPEGVTSIGSNAFEGCSSLTNVHYNGTIEDWCNITFSSTASNPMSYANNFYMLDSNNEYYEVTEIVIPETITSIGNSQFYGFNNITSIEIPNSITNIDSFAFSNCSSLTTILIPGGVTSIGYSAFSNFSSLTIYCEVESQPSGWNRKWNYSDRPVYWYSETEPETEGNYWHYVDGVVTKWGE